MLSERDVRRYTPSVLRSSAEEYNEFLEQTEVGTVMTKEVATIGPEALLAEATELMRSERLGCLPVMEGKQLVGIITRDDIVRFANHALRGAIPTRPEPEASGADA